MAAGADLALESVYRADWGRIVATLIRLVGDFDIADSPSTPIESGVTVKLPDATLSAPPLGPVSVKLLAGATGVTELETAEAALVPAPLVAVTVQVYGVPLVSPETVIGLEVPLAVWPPQSAV